MTQNPIDYRLTRQDMAFFNDNAPQAAYQIIQQLGFPEAVTMNLMGMLKITYFTTPDAHREILVNQPDHFHRDPRSSRMFNIIMGESVFTSEGSEWKRRRKLVQPAFHATRVNNYAEIMTQHGAEAAAGWDDGETINVERQMTEITMRVIASTLFGVDLRETAEHLGDLMQTILRVGEQQIQEIIPRPRWWQSPAYRRQRAAQTELEQMLTDMIQQRRKTGADHGDLLSMLLLSRDEDGDLLTDTEALAEAITLFVAGHETTAVTLMWAFKLLADHPEIEATLHAELDRVLGGRLPTLSDLPNLPYTEMVMKETLRLYPAAYAFGRMTTQPVTVRDYTLPQKRMVMLTPYILHRNPAHYDNPEAFQPERFADNAERPIDRYAFMPFGAGPRVCLGNSFAMLEIRLLLAAIAGQVRLSIPDGVTVTQKPQVALHPHVKGAVGVPMIVERRQPRPQTATAAAQLT